ncbi:serine proteinase inhibitor [Onchocerca flexuosa]|uniref:Serine proteinase inhibitor n=1 Tax=Onchocerca flexuosa TaxID=387005 RepID=A0A238BMY8_9BILA|nr:serine proteinase inhibitor [Onchocerca flexuosa]
MIYLAANGRTKQELHNVLGGTASENELRVHFAKLLGNMANVENENYTLHLANRFYLQQGLLRKRNIKRTLELYYNESLHYFENGRKHEFVKEVDEWISSETNSEITELIAGNSINQETKMLLLSSIYFNGTWLSQFFPQGTREMNFYISENKLKKVPMMTQTNYFYYYEDSSAKVVKLPYVDRKIEMLLIMPKKRFGLLNVLRNLTGNDLLRYFYHGAPRRVELRLPKFELIGKRDLKETLQKFGITHAFSISAEFTKLTFITIFVNNVMHASSIAVNEKGTGSVAYTGACSGDPLSATEEFIADQPFLFAIVHDRTTISFAGQFGF